MHLISVVPLTIFPGGYDGSDVFSDVLRYEPESDEWTKTTDLATPRSGHGMSTLNKEALAAFCSPVESGSFQSPNYPALYPNNHDQVTQAH